MNTSAANNLSAIPPIRFDVRRSSTTGPTSKRHVVDFKRPWPITIDVNQYVDDCDWGSQDDAPDFLQVVPGVPLQVLRGGRQCAVIGRDLIVDCSTEVPGVLIVEGSDDGFSWHQLTSSAVNAGERIGVRFAPRSVQYRCTFVALAAHTHTVDVRSQVRDANA